jgi:hypothetical protein
VTSQHLRDWAKLLGTLAGVSTLLAWLPGSAMAAVQPGAPIVVHIGAALGSPLSPKKSSVTFTATVNPSGEETSYCFDYGLTSKYNSIHHDDDPAWEDGETTPAFLPAATTPITIHGYAYGLKPGTTYHYRVVLTGGGTTTSKDRTFTTQK